MIVTARLELIPCDEGLLRAIVAGPEEAAVRLGLVVPEGWPEFPEAYAHALELIARGEDPGAWWTYVFIDRRRGALIGSGGYKGPPDPEGHVEIGYETAPAFRGRGYATEAAAGLIAHAFEAPDVRAVLAHTLPEANTSTRILEHSGMTKVGVVEDPTDGTIWRWRVERHAWERRGPPAH